MVLAMQAQAEKGVRESLVAKWAMMEKLFFRSLLGSAIFARGGMNEPNRIATERHNRTRKRGGHYEDIC